MAAIQCENDWWKWGDASKRRKLTDYPALQLFFQTQWNKPLEQIVANRNEFEVIADEARAKQTAAILQQHLPDIKIETSASGRLKKSLGKSYPDVLAAVCNTPIVIPDTVVYPGSHEQVQQILQLCSEHKILIVPFGGGSNVVRAFTLPDKTQARIVVDMSLCNELLQLDENNHTATFGCGIMGPALEKILNEKGFTLGHFPQSFEYSALGGWIATRSAGQESSGYGRIEDMVISMRIATPAGTITTTAYEGDAEGISIKPLFFGSEGLLGIITEAKVRIHPLPKNKKWLVAVFPSYQSGIEALRGLVQKDIFPTVARFSDERETFFLSFFSEQKSGVLASVKKAIEKWVLQFKNIEKPCLMMVRFDGEESETKHTVASEIFKQNKGFNIGEKLGKKWETSRFGLPYLRDDMVVRGVFVDTMETVVPWNKIDVLRKKLHERLQLSEAFGRDKGILLAHVSHVYTASASIYFTVLTAQQKDKEYEQWKKIKTIVTDTIVAEGGAVSHHHSIGTDHRKWYLQRTDTLTRQLLQNIKRTLDPQHILNPGKLFDEQK